MQLDDGSLAIKDVKTEQGCSLDRNILPYFYMQVLEMDIGEERKTRSNQLLGIEVIGYCNGFSRKNLQILQQSGYCERPCGEG